LFFSGVVSEMILYVADIKDDGEIPQNNREHFFSVGTPDTGEWVYLHQPLAN